MMALICNLSRVRVHFRTKLHINSFKRLVNMEAAGAYDPSKLTVEEKKNLIVRNLEVKKKSLVLFALL